MCGIGGKLSFDRRPDASLGEAMAAQMHHRGPDDEGVYATGPVVLSHCRLSILDLSDAGHQPMANADGSIHIVFNGEIYNYRELREQVAGYRFTSETDTEVLLHLYEEYGTDCLQYLRGMFAFAIWDEDRERLFIARDRLGQKPLFYRDGEDGFCFGSTIKALLADETVDARPDIDAIHSYLTYQYVPVPRTGFSGLRQLPPASYMLVTEDGIDRERYWNLSFANQFETSADRLAQRLREVLTEATRLRMRSDVPVGMFLSGGLDSSIVTALMAEQSETPVETFSIGFDVGKYDELAYAREVAEAFGTNHHEYVVDPPSTDVLPELIEHYEMPFGDPSALPTYYVSRIAATDVTVALTGDAGDENFAGYDRYVYDTLASRAAHVPGPLRRGAGATLDVLPDAARRVRALQYADRFVESVNSDPVGRYAQFICHLLGEDARAVWDGPTTGDELAALRSAFEAADGPTRLDRLMHTDIVTYLPDDLLVKVDRASMAHSLEVRSPFLDHKLVEFAARVPSSLKLRGREKKWLLKQTFRDDLPDTITERSKQGFGIPLNEWFRGDLRDSLRESLSRLGARESFDPDGLDELFVAHLDERRDAGYPLWDLFVLEHWYEQYIDDR